MPKAPIASSPSSIGTATAPLAPCRAPPGESRRRRRLSADCRWSPAVFFDSDPAHPLPHRDEAHLFDDDGGDVLKKPSCMTASPSGNRCTVPLSVSVASRIASRASFTPSSRVGALATRFEIRSAISMADLYIIRREAHLVARPPLATDGQHLKDPVSGSPGFSPGFSPWFSPGACLWSRSGHSRSPLTDPPGSPPRRLAPCARRDKFANGRWS